MFKKIGIVIGVIILIIILAGGVMIYRLAGMVHHFEQEIAKATSLDLSQIKDGTYPGSFGDFVVSVKLEVTVKNHKITRINIKEQNCGQGYEARGTIDRIIVAQSPKVDAVTGASSSSRCIMIAVDQALRNAAH